MELNHDNYFSPEAMMEYMSTSQFKAFESCEAAALANLKGEWLPEDKECFLEGKYFEACICGQKKEFLDSHPEMVSSRGSTKGELKSNSRGIANAVDSFSKQPLIMDVISRCMQQVIVTGVIADIEFKGCIDFFDPLTGDGYDAKLMRDFKKVYSTIDGCHVNWYFARGYHYQAAIYRELIRQTFGYTGRQHLIASTKENVPDTAFLQFTDEILDNAMEIVAEFAPRYDAIKRGEVPPNRCEHCDYCKSTKIITEYEMIEEYE